MAQKTLILGGARSGKSRYALQLAQKFLYNGQHPESRGIFIATAQPLDQEMAQRIQAHKEQRGNGWQTIEEPTDLAGVLGSLSGSPPVVLIDCLTLWLSNILIHHRDTHSKWIEPFYDALEACCYPVILVSNEVGLGLVPPDPLSRLFRDVAGQVHQKTAQICDSVILMTAGIPLSVKSPGGNNDR